MDKYWGKAKDGRYICPVCNEKFDEDLLSTGKCPNCGFHEQGGIKPKIKGAKHDEGKPRPSLVPVEGIEAIMQVREYGMRKYGDAEDWRSIAPERWHDALLRHVLHIWDNPLALDYESGLPALWHVITNGSFLCEAYKEDLQAAIMQKAVDDDLKEWSDWPKLCCTEVYCDSFSTKCENHCIRHLNVKDCKGVTSNG